MEQENGRKLWSSTQAYSVAVVCLFVGLATGYLLHAPSPTAVVSARASQQPPSSTAVQPSPEQLRRIADRQVEPLLAKLDRNPSDAALLAEIGKVYFYSRQFDAAAQYYERSARITPNADVLTTLGTTYHRAGADDKATESLNRALAVDPNFANALYNLAVLKWEVQSDPQAAIALLQKLLEAHPNHPRRAQVEEMISRAKQHLISLPPTPTNP